MYFASRRPAHGRSPDRGHPRPHFSRPRPRRSASSRHTATSARRRSPGRPRTTRSRRSTRSPPAASTCGRQRDEFHFVWKQDDRRFHPAGAGRAARQGRRSASQGRADGAGQPGCRRALRGRRRSTATASPRCSSAAPRARSPSRSQPAIKGADVLQLERTRQHLHLLRREVRRAVRHQPRSPDLALGDEVLVGLALCSHNPDVIERAVFSDVRIIRPAKDGFVPYRDYIGSVLEILDVQSGRRQIDPPLRAAVRGAELDAGRQRADLQRQRPRRRIAALFRFDLATRQPTRDRHRHRQPQQQRSRAVVRRHDARHQRPEPGSATTRSRRSYTVPRRRRRRRSGSRRSRRRTSTAGRPTAKWLVYTGGRNGEFDIYTHRLRRQRAPRRT